MLYFGVDLFNHKIEVTVLTQNSQYVFNQRDNEQTQLGVALTSSDRHLEELYDRIKSLRTNSNNIWGSLVIPFILLNLLYVNKDYEYTEVMFMSSRNPLRKYKSLLCVDDEYGNPLEELYNLLPGKCNFSIIYPQIVSFNHFFPRTEMQGIDEDIAILLPYLYYGAMDRENSFIFLYAFDECSFSYSIVEAHDGNISIIHRNMLKSISGKAISHLLLKYVSVKYEAATNTSLFEDVSDTTRLLEECSFVRSDLSTVASSRIDLVKLGGRQNVIITRREFQALLRLPFLILKKTIEKSFKELDKRVEAVDYVVASGDVQGLPGFDECLKSLFVNCIFDCGTTVQFSSSLGSCIYSSCQCPQMECSTWCYRISTNTDHFSVVGNSLQCITHDVMIIPISFTAGLANVRIVVERCLEKNLKRALSLKDSKGLWEHVHTYTYPAVLNSAFSSEESNPNVVGAENEFTPFVEGSIPQLDHDCIKIESRYVESDQLVLTINQVHKGQSVFASHVRFIYNNGTVMEDMKVESRSIPTHHLMSKRLSPILPAMSQTTSVTSSSVISSIISDQSQSCILKIRNMDSHNTYIRCNNLHLRTRNLPHLINVYPPAISSSLKREMSFMDSRQYFQKKKLPQFYEQPLSENKQNKRMFFTGPSNRSSPITACYYKGTFVNGERHGQGSEFSISHDLVYKGEWKHNKYDGEGIQVFREGGYATGTFKDGLMCGKGDIFSSSKEILYSGEFVNGKKHGKGIEFEEGGLFYEGTFENNLRHGEGVIRTRDTVLFTGCWDHNLKHGKGREIVNQSVYEGDFVHGFRQGNGVLSRLDGAVIYKGEWKYDKRHGKGVFYSTSGMMYEGSFVLDAFEGSGCQYQDGKLVYEGSFANKERDGYGKLYRYNSKNERILWMEGEFKRGKLNGECSIYDEEGGLIYQGGAADNMFSGKGVQYLPSGVVLKGCFKNGKLHGKGKLMVEDDLMYSGEWLYGKQHGYGELHDDRGLYEGMFVNGEKEGKGVYTLFSGELYCGEFRNGLYNGFGKFINVEGRVIYEGEWRDGQRCGIGRCYFPNGEYYHGQFLANMMNGTGRHYYCSGRLKFCGTFRNDKRNGEGIQYDESGDVVERGYYVDDTLLV